MKRFIAVLLAALLMFSLCACSNSVDPQESETPDSTSTDEGEDNGDFEDEPAPTVSPPENIRIGYTFWDSESHGLAGDAAASLNLMAKALGIEVLYNTGSDYSADGVITAVENFIAAGCQGVIVCNFAESSMINIGKICKEAGVYFAQFYRTLSDPDVIVALEENEYYVGRVHENEFAAAYSLTEALYEAGSKNVALFTAQHGDDTFETRAEGFRQACEDLGMNIVIEEWEVGTEDCTTAASNVLLAYPEIDGLFLGTGSYIPYAIAAQENLGIEDMPMVGVDFDSSLEEYLLGGQVPALAGGHHNDPLFSALLVYNAICGAYDSADYPIDIINNIITINGTEEYNYYCDYFIGWDKDFEDGQAYNVEEIQQFTIVHNPNHKWQNIFDAAGALSIADVLERHSHFVD